MKAVRRAVPEDDVVRVSVDESRQGRPEPRRSPMKVFVANQVGLDLALQRAPSGLCGDSWERTLMSRIEPDAPVEGSEGDVREGHFYLAPASSCTVSENSGRSTLGCSCSVDRTMVVRVRSTPRIERMRRRTCSSSLLVDVRILTR